MNKRLIFLALVMLMALAVGTQAQDTIPTPVGQYNPDAYIGWPPPVYVLRGDATLYGTANVSNMTNYFLEFRPLEADGSTQPQDAPWFPVTLPIASRVLDNELGSWDTRTAPDGMYELRLTVNTADGNPVFFRVSPLRVENNPPPFVATQTGVLVPTQPALQPTIAVPTIAGRPTLPPTPTALDTSPRVTAALNANVRRGDSTRYDIVGYLPQGTTAPVIGISSTGSGWFYIQLDNGTRGFIAPSTVQASGDMRSVPRIDPPPPPVTDTPVPTATPPTSADLFVTGFRTDPVQPVCLQTYTIYANIHNGGTGPTSGSATIGIVDTRASDGTVAGTAVGAVPVIQAGGDFVSVIPITVSTYFNEVHRITLTIDPEGRVPETNEGNNTYSITYTLLQGGC